MQDHGLVVEMIHLASESGLPQALQEVRDDGSPFCIPVEQSNVKLSSCTVVMLHESIKTGSFSSLVDRHMPLEDALVLVAKEYRRFFAHREQHEHTGISLRAGDLVHDFLARECLTSYSVPWGVQHLLFLLNEGRHLYRNELNLLIDYLKTRKGQLEGIFHCPLSFPILNPRRSSTLKCMVNVNKQFLISLILKSTPATSEVFEVVTFQIACFELSSLLGSAAGFCFPFVFFIFPGLEMPNPLARSDHSSFQGRNTPIMGKPPPLLPTPRKRSFPGPPPPVPAKSPLIGERTGGLLLQPGQCFPPGVRC
ncbi:hypothetical protein J1605_000558 [Eschrichtius robustus]|uniref:Uncharacterized protein n=1 Tax=Eschrichtius robustus TaxID=9764 RepID=A0AB34GSU9_ESCRO|nr:hypothetical protein J1605_000558 [Eschrichtius robustus]